MDENLNNVINGTSEAQEATDAPEREAHVTDTPEADGKSNGKEGLGFVIAGGVFAVITAVMFAIFTSQLISVLALAAEAAEDRGFLGIAIVLSLIVMLAFAVGCILAALAELFLASLALKRSGGVVRYIAVAEMILSAVFIVASVVMTVVAMVAV